MKVSTVLTLIVLFTAIFVAFIAKPLLTAGGLHPKCPKSNLSFSGKRALVVSTSHATLDPSPIPTGLFLSELTGPYYEFLDAGIKVDVASVKGGKIPVDPMSWFPFLTSSCVERYHEDENLQNLMENSKKIDDVNFTDYDLVYFAGGWGAAYDFAQSEVLGQQVTNAHKQKKILGSACHGALAFVSATTEDGKPLVEGKRVTGVTNKQLWEVGAAFFTAVHPETELRNKGAEFEADVGLIDFLHTKVTVDGQIVSGQNQNSGCFVAQKMMELL